MPFDGFDPQDQLDPLSVVDRLSEVLADETNWAQGSFSSVRTIEWPSLPPANKYMASNPAIPARKSNQIHCLYGWLNIIDHGTVFWWNNEPFDFNMESVVMVHRYIVRRTTPLLSRLIGRHDRVSGIRFNDNHTHKAMMQMIAKVRRDIVGCRR